MKYIELKSSLKEGLRSVYVISGDDRYLCFDALKKITDKADIMIKDMNSITLSGEGVSAKEIVDSANIYPFGDAYRLVVVKNYAGTTKDELEVLKEYFASPLSSTILVLFCPEKPENYRAMSDITLVDCSKIDPKMIAAFIKNRLAKEEINSSDEAIEKLIMFCNSDMARINSELEKLVAYTAETKSLTPELVTEFVIEDKEYQVFELAGFIAKGDSKSAINLVDSFMIKAGGGLQVLGPLYSNYRRALYVSINKDKTTAELAAALGVKEFAIKMLKPQVSIFSAKKLKQITDMVAKYERKIKLGQIKENVAIKTIVFSILNLRGDNG